MKVLLILALLLFLLAILRFGVRVRYDEAGFALWVKVSRFRFQLLPKKPKTEKQRRKARAKAEKKRRKQERKAAKEAEKAEKKPKKEEPEPQKKGGKLSFLLQAIPPVARSVGKLLHKIRIDDLTLHIVCGGEDPSQAALMMGRGNAALGMLWPVIAHNFKVKRHHLTCDVDFDQPGHTATLQAALTITLGQTLCVAVPLLITLLKLRARSKAKAASKEGEKPDESKNSVRKRRST